MRRHFLVFCLLLSLGFSVSGKGYKITVHLAAAKERQVFLTHYYGASVFIDDTVMTDISGTGIFSGTPFCRRGCTKSTSISTIILTFSWGRPDPGHFKSLFQHG